MEDIVSIYLTSSSQRFHNIRLQLRGFHGSPDALRYSENTRAAGVVSGGPYYCVGSEPDPKYINCRLFADNLSVNEIKEYLITQEKSGNIDPTSNMKDSKVFLFHGTKDDVVIQDIGKLGYEVYKDYVDSIVAVFDFEAGHTWPTLHRGGSCLEFGVGSCDYDIAEQILTTAYGDLKPKTSMIQPNVMNFDQRKYFPKSKNIGLADIGYIYIPTNCQKNPDSCRVHMVLHGCFGNVETAETFS